jgi:hypothetical protein
MVYQEQNQIQCPALSSERWLSTFQSLILKQRIQTKRASAYEGNVWCVVYVEEVNVWFRHPKRICFCREKEHDVIGSGAYFRAGL